MVEVPDHFRKHNPTNYKLDGLVYSGSHSAARKGPRNEACDQYSAFCLFGT